MLNCGWCRLKVVYVSYKISSLSMKTTSVAERFSIRRSSLKAKCIKIWDPLRDGTKVNFHFHVSFSCIATLNPSTARAFFSVLFFSQFEQTTPSWIYTFFIYKFYIQQSNNYRLLKTFVTLWQQLTTVLYHCITLWFYFFLTTMFSNFKVMCINFHNFSL